MVYEEAVNANIRVADVLEQIEGLDKMIVLHKEQSPDDSMLKQYQYMRHQFYQELVGLMKEFHFKISEEKPQNILRTNKPNVKHWIKNTPQI
jgi:hypothetical protein